MSDLTYVTKGGVRVTRTVTPRPIGYAMDPVFEAVDTRRGVVLASSYEYPGRYKRWSMGFIDPPLELVTIGRSFKVTALNERGRVLIPAITTVLAARHDIEELIAEPGRIEGMVRPSKPGFAEEERSRQPSSFSVVRAIIDLFHSDQDEHLGLYGAFGYDLIFQFEPIEGLKERPADQRDMVLYLPDRLTIVDYYGQQAFTIDYDFVAGSRETTGLARDGDSFDPRGQRLLPNRDRDVAAGAYAELVRKTLPSFERGDMFEVVPGQTFFTATEASPTALFQALRRINPSPYGFLMNLGGEYLVGASPEMYVRVEGRRVETCPISGTIARGRDAIEDADRIRQLLNSAKDEAELTMCTDVDRNDKARVCEPGSVKVLGRRQIEMYSHLIHTVDHVEGVLRKECDALDAFLSHCWAVTVTGAPKRAAIAYIEEHEASPRRWYGGAIGKIGFDGNLNTGLTLRTIRLKDSIAEIRVGATLLHDSDPQAEEDETEIKAAALRKALASVTAKTPPVEAAPPPMPAGRRVLMVDCEDSFVLTLADYLRQAGAELTTLRWNVAEERLLPGAYDLVVFSPGPGRPGQFRVPEMIRRCAELGLPVFGVCLGVQGIVEAFGGSLGQLSRPVHGKMSAVHREGDGGRLLAGLPDRFPVGRYHSLFAEMADLPKGLAVTARTEDGVPMAIEHRSLPIAGVQFHPESIMSLGADVGPQIIANVMRSLAAEPPNLAKTG